MSFTDFGSSSTEASRLRSPSQRNSGNGSGDALANSLSEVGDLLTKFQVSVRIKLLSLTEFPDQL